MRVLIADDEATCLEVLREVLKADGYEVVVAHDGNEAWEILQNPQAPRLVFLDWNMPGMDGPEVCRRLRKRDGGNYYYLVMLTARNEPQSVEEAFRAGVNDFVTKAAPLSEFRTRIHSARRFLAVCDELHAAREALDSRCPYDLLTGLEKRPGALELLARQTAHARDRSAPLAVLLVQLDHFGLVRETYGARTGDAVVRAAAERIAARLRPYDLAGRYADHEFLLAAPDLDEKPARELAEAVRTAVGDETFCVRGKTVSVTASVGFVSARVGRDDDPAAFLNAATDALGEARRAGGNRTVAAASPAAAPAARN